LLLFLVNWALHPHSRHRIGFATGLEICTLWWRSAQNMLLRIIWSTKSWTFAWEFALQNSGFFLGNLLSKILGLLLLQVRQGSKTLQFQPCRQQCSWWYCAMLLAHIKIVLRISIRF
jgi:hypothetical protein